MEGLKRLFEAVQALLVEDGDLDETAIYERDAAASTSGQADSEKVGKALTEWLQEGGGYVHPALKLQSFGAAGNGFVAKGEVERGAELFRVPMRCVISEATVLADPVLSKLQAQLTVLRQFASPLLALFLVLERKRARSKWTPYLDSLPRRYSVPLYWRWEELLLLQGSPAWAQTIQLWKNCVRLYAVVRHVCSQNLDQLGLAGPPTFAEWRWALSAVFTRRNSVPVSSESSTLAMIPVWDMCNHKATGELTTGYDEEGKQVVCRAMQTFAAGDQVFIYYGVRSHVELLVNNGFLPDDDGGEPNAADYFLLRLSLNETAPLFAPKKKLLEQHKLPPTGDFALRFFGPGALALVFARISRLREVPEDGVALDASQPLSSDNEKDAAALLLTAVMVQLRKSALATEAAKGDTYHAQCALRLRRMEEAMMRAFMLKLIDYCRGRE